MIKSKAGVIIIGAGPAGLTAGYELSKHHYQGSILETSEVVGGLARTVEWEGYRFDIGAHRFFTKVSEIDRLWEEILNEPLQTCSRMTRILYGGKFYDYPLQTRNALKNMGILRAALCMLSYVKVRLIPVRKPANFEEWVINQFGARLYRMFFKSYTEKVWGCSCTQISADWAAQRIKGLNLGEAIRNALFGRHRGSQIKTLIDEFKYPRRGAGELWEQCARKVTSLGWNIKFQIRVTGLEVVGDKIATVFGKTTDDQSLFFPVSHVFSSMPLRELLSCLIPPPPSEVLQAASKLSYRDFLIVTLILDEPDIFPDNWIYVHSPEVKVGRIDNFGNWTPEMMPNRTTSCLAMEYFVFEGDELWIKDDQSLIDMAFGELRQIGLAKGKLMTGKVLRVPKAYPVYDPGYKERLDLIRSWLKANVKNLDCIGRNGQHRYNNQDHSMATALIAARNLVFDQDRDPWSVNEDAEYHEIVKTERAAPITPAHQVRV